ncbi:unnamed protein product, partial [marine sediment metagenome]
MKRFLLSVFIFIITLSFTATDVTFAKEKLSKTQKQANLEAKKKARAEERAKKKAIKEAKRKAKKAELAKKKAERAAKRKAKKADLARKKAERKAKRKAKKGKLATKKTTGKTPLWMPFQNPDKYLNSARSCLNKKQFASARTGAAYVANNCSIREKQIEAIVLLEQIGQIEAAYTASKEAAAKIKRKSRPRRLKKARKTKTEKLAAKRKAKKADLARKKAERKAKRKAK